jgi:polyhydroxybutyrate depolymerase
MDGIEAMSKLLAALLIPLALFSESVAAPPISQSKSIQCTVPTGRATHKVESRCLNLQIGAVTRTYRLYKPKIVGKNPLPVVLVLHGGGGSGSAMEGLSLGQFNRIADRRGALIVYPDGISRSWNDGRFDSRSMSLPTEPQDQVDDVGFLRGIVGKLAEQHSIDRKRIYATGMSNGGLMSYRLACDAADFIAAAVPVAANLSVELGAECRPSRAIPIAIVNGTDDPMMPWIGGQMKVLNSRRGAVLSAQESFERFSRLGDCALPITHSPRNQNPNDGTSVIRHRARECSHGGEVRLYEVLGGGHTWPGGSAYLGERLVGKVSTEMNAADEIWSFVSKYSLP